MCLFTCLIALMCLTCVFVYTCASLSLALPRLYKTLLWTLLPVIVMLGFLFLPHVCSLVCVLSSLDFQLFSSKKFQEVTGSSSVYKDRVAFVEAPLKLPGYMLPFMDFHTRYCSGPANRPSHSLGGVSAGFSNFREGLPTEAESGF